MAQLMKGHEALGRITDALGLKGQWVNKVVIVCAMNQPVQVYVKRLIDDEQFDALADNLVEPTTRAPGEVQVTTVNGLEVDELGRVFVPAQEVSRMRAALEALADGRWGDAGVKDFARKALLAREGAT